jgi:hypothetical protein
MERGILSMIKKKEIQLSDIIPKKLTLKIEGVIKICYDKQKLKQYMTTIQPVQETLKGILHTEDENKHSLERMGNIKTQRKSRQVVKE